MTSRTWATLLAVVGYVGLAQLAIAAGGSLYDAHQFQPLTADRRAIGIGDPLTVLVVEIASAESRAETTSGSKFGIDAGSTDATGLARAGVSVDTDSSGTGKTTRTGSVKAQLSVRVEQKLESGNLFVRGQQLIVVNGEQQRIRVEGIVRPIDISADNIVLSTRLVDAKIEYSGAGWVSNNQKPGLFARLARFLGF